MHPPAELPAHFMVMAPQQRLQHSLLFQQPSWTALHVGGSKTSAALASAFIERLGYASIPSYFLVYNFGYINFYLPGSIQTAGRINSIVRILMV